VKNSTTVPFIVSYILKGQSHEMTIDESFNVESVQNCEITRGRVLGRNPDKRLA
jgi:hypothetical protein